MSGFKNNFDGVKYFTPEEFRCPCCHSLGEGIVHELLEILDRMREELGSPLLVSSGYRCPEHNAYIGGATHSQHLCGRAADIWTPRSEISVDNLYWLALAMSDGGHKCGIGRYYEQGFIHIDVRGHEARW